MVARNYYLYLSIALITVLTSIRIFILGKWQLELYPDEAQYWGWSKEIDFGYFSKPPMIAWLIGISTAIFGDNEFGVRFFAPIMHGVTAIFVYILGMRIGGEKTGFYSSFTYLTLPGVTFSSLVMNTDVSLIFFWSMSLCLLHFALEQRDKERRAENDFAFLFLGIAIGLGLLSKYTMILFFISGYVYLAIANRSWLSPLFKRNLYLSVVISFLIFLPNILWNYGNDFISFKHVKHISEIDRSFFHLDHFLNFFLSQFVIFGPLFFFLYIYFSLTKFRSFVLDKKYLFLHIFSSLIIVIFMILSFVTKSFANWSAFAYVAATILLVKYLLENQLRHLLFTALIINFICGMIYLHHPDVIRLTERYFPTQAALMERFVVKQKNWRSFADKVIVHLELDPDLILVVSERKLLAELKFYAKDTVQNRIRKLKNYDGIGDHYDLTIPFNPVKGNSYLVISSDFPFESGYGLKDQVLLDTISKEKLYNLYKVTY